MTEEFLKENGRIINRIDFGKGDSCITYKLYCYNDEYYLVELASGQPLILREVNFTDYTRIGDSMIAKKCCICGQEFTGYGNNPYPVSYRGKCCDECNSTIVIPKRLEQLKYEKELGIDE